MSLSDHILSEIVAIKSASSTLEKERILVRNQNSPTFIKIIQYTYNPYIRYHIRKVPDEVIGSGLCELSSETWALLNKLSLRKLTGTAARETLFSYISSLTPAAAMILKLIIRKDLKAGIAVKTINKVHPGLIPTFDCQLVEEWDDTRVEYPILIAPKIDGTRGEKRGNNIYTRNGHQIVGVKHIVDYIKTTGSYLDTSGELFIPGMPFRRSDGIIRSNMPDKPAVRYAMFDLPSLTQILLEDRIAHLAKSFYPLETKPLPPVVYIPHVVANSLEEVDKMYNYWRSRGYEGLVGKNPKSLPFAGRNYDWMRKVNTISAEYRIIDIYESDEKPGFLGGIIIEGGIKVGSGFVDAERIEYLKHPERIIGRLATIVAKEKTAAGSLRQPIFKAVRWDI